MAPSSRLAVLGLAISIAAGSLTGCGVDMAQDVKRDTNRVKQQVEEKARRAEQEIDRRYGD